MNKTVTLFGKRKTIAFNKQSAKIIITLLILGALLNSIGFAQGKSVNVSIKLKGFKVPNMYLFPDLINHHNDYTNLGAINAGNSIRISPSNKFGLNFRGLSGENTFAVFQKDATGKIYFAGWQSGGEWLWVHIDNKVSPVEISIGPADVLLGSQLKVKNMYFSSNPISPYNYTPKIFVRKNLKTVYQLNSKIFSKAVVYKDYKNTGKPGAADQLTINTKNEVDVKYTFSSDDVFESSFVSIPVKIPQCDIIIIDVKSDGSKNNFFIILHDSSGEQHLVLKTTLVWQKWLNIGIDLKPYLKSPAKSQRLIIHWSGDENQKIDFPVKIIDIGVSKCSRRIKNKGQIRFRNVQFAK